MIQTFVLSTTVKQHQPILSANQEIHTCSMQKDIFQQSAAAIFTNFICMHSFCIFPDTAQNNSTSSTGKIHSKNYISWICRHYNCY